MRRAGLVFVFACAMLVAACGALEPSDAQLRAAFTQNRGTLEELRRMFAEDMQRYQLVFVDAANIRLALCGENRRQEACLDRPRWLESSMRLKRAGIKDIETHETNGIYFHVHRTLPPVFIWGGPYRSQGLVYAPGSPKVTHNHDDTEERIDLGEGWYSYLMIDD